MTGRELDDRLQSLALPAAYRAQVDTVLVPLATRIEALRVRATRTVVVGLCGAQGSGKSTLCTVLELLLKQRGLSCTVLSLDDLYLTHDDRETLAARRHPLFATRGPPGTHEVALGEHLLDVLGRPGAVRLPRFDKAKDTRAPELAWPEVQAPVDVVLFEGWCVGARPEDAAALAEPVNDLERQEDANGEWRRAIDASLADDYARLFSRLDALVLLAVPDFESVFAWRTLQEHRLRTRAGGGMSDAEVARFIRHYERLTRHILTEMPARADAVIPIAPDHTMLAPIFREDGALPST